MEKNIFGFVDISHRRYKLRRDVEQTPLEQEIFKIIIKLDFYSFNTAHPSV
jgi:hypothetical protein